MTYAEYIHWGLGIPFTDRVIGELDYEDFSRTRLIPFLIAPVYVLALLFIFNLSSSTFLYLNNTQMKYLCQEGPAASVIIDPPIYLGRSMPMALMALLERALLAAIQMSQATPFLKAPRQWVLFHPYSFSFLSLHLNTYSNNLSFKIQPTVQEHEELVLLAGNLKIELTEYSRQLYGGKDDEDDDDGGGGGGDSAGGLELTLSH